METQIIDNIVIFSARNIHVFVSFYDLTAIFQSQNWSTIKVVVRIVEVNIDVFNKAINDLLMRVNFTSS